MSLKIQRLYIGDFGVIRDQILDNIHPGIVVIGGLNRAGKSTFMQVLRYLGYGFPKSQGLPPATSKYKVEADIRLDSGDIYNLSLIGYAQPVLNRISGSGKEIMSPEELYGIDAFTYKQLFTITLDELNKNYGITDDEKRKIQAILLGAGFKDMLLIPQLEQEFYKEGDKIGGKRGSPRVKQFKPYYNAIEKGKSIRNKALSQVDEYQQKQQELKEIKILFRQISNELEQLQNEIVQLDIIKNNYKTYIEIQELETWLHNNEDKYWEEAPTEYDLARVKSLKDEYLLLKKDFQSREIELGIPPQRRELLLDKKDEMASLVAGVSGINERIRQYTQQSEEYKRKKDHLIAKIKETNSAWSEDSIKDIAEIRTDNISHGRLDHLVDKYKDLTSELNNHKANLIRIKEEYNAFLGQTAEVKDRKPWGEVRKYFYSSLAFIIVGIILTFINPLSGILLGLGGIIGTAVYYIMDFLNTKEIRTAMQAQKQQLEASKIRIQGEEKIIGELEDQLDNIKIELNEYKKKLGLSLEAPDSTLPRHLLRIRDIQEEIAELHGISAKISNDRNYIEEKFNNYLRFINLFSQQNFKEEDMGSYPIDERWNRVVAELYRWNDYLKEVQELGILQQKVEIVKKEIINIIKKYQANDQSLLVDKAYEDLENKIVQFIDKSHKAMEYNQVKARLREAIQSVLTSMSSDGIRRAFGYSLSHVDVQDEELLRIFMGICGTYASKEEVEEVYSHKCRQRDEKVQRLEELKESQQKLEAALENLATTEKLVQGQRQIDNARAELRILAQNYATYMTAAFLLRETGKNLLQGMKDNIMDSAGNIFSKMTNGDYSGILPSESLLEADFEAILPGKTQAQTVDMLSRGTREQLYLSVRLSRIMDIKPNLPIIIDDSFANFDSIHLSQSIAILSQLAQTHQIFILTCHGELVDEIARLNCEAQYWRIEKGKLECCNDKDLSEYLRVS